MCNHIHLMDVACIIAMTKRQVRFMAKKELFDNKLIGWFLTKIGTFPISRGDADISGIRNAPQGHQGGRAAVHLPRGHAQPRAQGAAAAAARGCGDDFCSAGAPIVPMWVEGGYAPWKPCRILAGKPMDLTEYAGIRRTDAATMKKLTGQMEQALLACRAELMDEEKKK